MWINIFKPNGLLGPELVTNGTFNGNAIGWFSIDADSNTPQPLPSHNWAYNLNSVKHTTGAVSVLIQSISITSGHTYLLTFKILASSTQDSLSIALGDGESNDLNTVGVYQFELIAGTVDADNPALSIGTDDTHEIGSISVKEILNPGWNNVSKPGQTILVYDDIISYDNSSIPYDGATTTSYTNINKPVSSTWTNVPKPS